MNKLCLSFMFCVVVSFVIAHTANDGRRKTKVNRSVMVFEAGFEFSTIGNNLHHLRPVTEGGDFSGENSGPIPNQYEKKRMIPGR